MHQASSGPDGRGNHQGLPGFTPAPPDAAPGVAAGPVVTGAGAGPGSVPADPRSHNGDAGLRKMAAAGGGAVLAARGPSTVHARSVPSPGACVRRRAPRAAEPRGRHHGDTTGEYGGGIGVRPQHCAVRSRGDGLTGGFTPVSARLAVGRYGLLRRWIQAPRYVTCSPCPTAVVLAPRLRGPYDARHWSEPHRGGARRL